MAQLATCHLEEPSVTGRSGRFVRLLLLCAAALAANLADPVRSQARLPVEASVPTDLAVTVYRDPDRGPYEEMDRDRPQGFAMISETRTVTLPPGESTILFNGVAEGMVAVSAIVTGLPGGTIEKNRNADLLGPAALVDGTLGNRVTITRTNPGTGVERSESATVRTRADGGLVLETADGFEAVRCSGLPERLTFDAVPQGLSAQPVFSIETRDDTGGTYEVVLTYLSWGFDWQANYVATLKEGGARDGIDLQLLSWLTVLNDNSQLFANAELLAIAGTLNVESDYRTLADPPQARPLRLTCYPLGSSLAGSDEPRPRPPPPPPPAQMAAYSGEIIVTAMRREGADMAAPVMAEEEALGDLKLYRFPERVDINAKGLKQVAFLNRDEVGGRLLYSTSCEPWAAHDEARPAQMVFETLNDPAHGLDAAMPAGRIAFFEPSP